MDQLTKRYAKALGTVAVIEYEIAATKALQETRHNELTIMFLESYPKDAEWKTKARIGNDKDKALTFLISDLMVLNYELTKAKARLTIIEDAVKRRRAREYRHDG